MNGKFNKPDFIKELTENLPEPPAYFPENVKLNQVGYLDFEIVLKNSLNKIAIDEFKELIKS